VNTGAFPGPLRHFLAQLDELRSGDIHNHGHVLGTGPSPYSLILLGDDMYLFEREEYDPEQGTWRKLAPGDPGQSHR